MIFLENLSGSPLKSTSALSPMNPPKIHINTTGNLWKIPEESTLKIPFNFRVDSCLNFHPNFRVDSSPPSIHHPRGFPAECGDFACWVFFLVHCLVTQTHSMINRAWIGIGFLFLTGGRWAGVFKRQGMGRGFRGQGRSRGFQITQICLVLKTKDLVTNPPKPEDQRFAFLTGKI